MGRKKKSPELSKASPASNERGEEASPQSKERRLFWIALFAAAAITGFVYLPSTDFGFVYDDREQILQNTRIRLADYPAKAFQEDLWRFRTPDPDKPNPGGQYYRPIFALYLWANWQRFGELPQGWHMLSLLLHLANTLLVGRLALRLRAPPLAAAAAALLFGLHPIHAESVAWISGSTDLLLAIFTLGALLLAFRAENAPSLSWPRRIFSWSFFALAALTKETAYVFPILFAAVRWLEGRERGEPDGKNAARGVFFSIPYGVIAFAVFFARLKVIGFLAKPLTPSALDGRQTLLTLPRVLLEYVSMTLTSAPAGLGHPIHPPAGAASISFWLPLALVAGLAAAALVSRALPLETGLFAAAGIFLPMLPVLNLKLLIPDALVQDRYLYLSTAFAVPALIIILVRRFPLPNLPRGAVPSFALPAPLVLMVAILAIAAGFRTAILRDTFRDEISLFTRATKDAPSNGIFHHRLGLALLEAGRAPEAIRQLEEAVRLEPNDWVNEANLALAHSRAGNFAASADHQGRALDIAERTGETKKEPRFATLAVQRGNVLTKLRKFDEAQGSFERAVAIDPNLSGAYDGLCRLAFERGDNAAAERNARKMIELEPGEPAGHGALGSALTAEGRYREAEEEFHVVERLLPNSVETDIGLAQVYIRTKRIPEAREAVLRALRKEPDNRAAAQLAAAMGIVPSSTTPSAP